MSKRENHWYLLGATIHAYGELKRPRAWEIGLVILITLILGGLVIGAPESIPKVTNSSVFVPVFALLVFGAGFALLRWRQSAMRTGYLRAMKYEGPEKVVDVIVRSMKGARAMADADAFSAKSRAIAYALYGRGEDATNALSEVSWGAKAPLIQAVGLSAEGIVELLCRRNVQHALELNRKACELASVSGALPGAAQSERYFGACAAVSEALLNVESPSSLKWLEEAAADGRFPPLQLLASFGLAAAMDHSGNSERASRLRAFIVEVAPHCRPLQLKPADFSASRESPSGSPGPVSASLSSAGASAGPGIQERAAKKKLIRAAGIMVGLWVALIALLVVLQIFVVPAM